jgi:hypothetical protein
MAFKRPLPIIARILLGDTFKRLAASVVLMIFMAQSIAFSEIARLRNNFLDNQNSSLYSDRTHQKRAGWQVR